LSNLNRHPVRRTAAGVLAGALAFSGAFAAGTPAFAATGFALDRIQGDDRYETSANIAAQFGAADGAILASGENRHVVDALSASFLAGIRQDPVLLTASGQLSAEVLAQLNALTSKNVTIVGGEMAVSAAVETQLRNAGFTVTRLQGDDRYETSEAIIRAGVAEGQESRVGILVSGQSPVDALAAGPLAYKNQHPVFLTAGGTIPQATLDAMQAAGTTSVIIVGGTTVVPETVQAQLAAANISVVTRLGGANRSETSRLVADYLIENAGFSATTFNVASGANNGVDALSGAALSGRTNTVLLVTNTATDIGSVDEFATARSATLTTTGRIFGGTTVVPEAVETALETAGVGTTQSATTRPELRSAVIMGTVTEAQRTPANPVGTTVRYTFDENVLSAGAPPVAANFKLFNADGSQADSPAEIVSTEAASVVVRFTGITTTTAAGTLTVATVVPGAVTDVDGNTNPEGDAAIGTTTAGGGATTLAAGITDGPDLMSVGGFRQAAEVNTTAVDFVFDEAAFVANSTGFAFILPAEGSAEIRATGGPAVGSAAVSAGGTASGGTVAGGNGTTTLTVIFPGTVTAADVARAIVDAGTVSDAQQDTDATTAATGDLNPLQAADVSNEGNTAEPDLVSVVLRPSVDGSNGGVDAAVFTFDQAVNEAPAANVANFMLYTDDGTVRVGSGEPLINTAGDSRQVLVNFAEGVGRVVGASVEDAAVTAGVTSTNVTADPNEEDEVGVAGTTVGGTQGQTAGRTAVPDLTAVSIARGPSTTDPFGNVTVGQYQATYTFDEDVDVVSPTMFKLYLADGTMLTSSTCAVGTGAEGATDDENFDNTVVCTAFTGGTGTAAEQNAQLGSATLGTVMEDAVDNQGAGTVGNPDGAEFTTGGTGTPVA
jgi:putative cell wall-binding protein